MFQFYGFLKFSFFSQFDNFFLLQEGDVVSWVFMYEKHPSEELSSYITFCIVISGRTFGRNMSISLNGISKKKTIK